MLVEIVVACMEDHFNKKDLALTYLIDGCFFDVCIIFVAAATLYRLH